MKKYIIAFGLAAFLFPFETAHASDFTDRLELQKAQWQLLQREISSQSILAEDVKSKCIDQLKAQILLLEAQIQSPDEATAKKIVQDAQQENASCFADIKQSKRASIQLKITALESLIKKVDDPQKKAQYEALLQKLKTAITSL